MDQPGKKDQAEETDQVEKRIMRRKRQKNKTRSKDCSAKVDTPQNRSRNRTKKNSIPDRYQHLFSTLYLYIIFFFSWLEYEPIGKSKLVTVIVRFEFADCASQNFHR